MKVYASMIRVTLVIGLTVALLTGCAPKTVRPEVSTAEAQREAVVQREFAGELYRKRSLRVNEVYRRLLVANAEFCQESQSSIGVSMFNVHSLTPTWHEWTHEKSLAAQEAIEFYGADEFVRIMEVIPSSPAASVGLEVGDIVTQIGDVEIGVGKSARKALKKVGESNVLDKTIEISFVRNGEQYRVQVVPELTCQMPLALLRRDELNAYADGTNVYFTMGMLRFVENDDELALILSHEMAHNIRGHIESQQTNMLIGGLIGAVIGGLAGSTDTTFSDIGQEAGALAYSQEFESEADYVGVYLAGRAGYDVSQAAYLWRRLGAENPRSIHLEGMTHPSTTVRFKIVQKAGEEVAQKRDRGLPLIPEEKE